MLLLKKKKKRNIASSFVGSAGHGTGIRFSNEAENEKEAVKRCIIKLLSRGFIKLVIQKFFKLLSERKWECCIH